MATPAFLFVGAEYSALCAALHEQCFTGKDRWSTEAFESLFSSPGMLTWISVQQDKPAGLLMLRHVGDEAEILTLCVLPEHRRKNVASALLRQGCRNLRVQGVETLFLEVSTHNHGAVALYKNWGFTECGLRKAYYQDGSDAAVLSYCLLNEIV